MGLLVVEAPDPFDYDCPWCPVVVVDAGLMSAVTVFERHLDRHVAAGHHRQATPPAARRLRSPA